MGHVCLSATRYSIAIFCHKKAYTLAATVTQGSVTQTNGEIFHFFIATDLPLNVVQTIQRARAPVTCSLYGNKLRVFGTVRKQNLICCFLHGAQSRSMYLNYSTIHGQLVPSWDLSIMLEAFSQPLFEPLQNMGIRSLI
jgi:hypothetical protein